MPLVERDGKFFCPTCGEELPKGYVLMVEHGEEFCEYCISNPEHNKECRKHYEEVKKNGRISEEHPSVHGYSSFFCTCLVCLREIRHI